MKSASDRFGRPSAIDLLLPQHREAHQLAAPRVVFVDDDVVADGVGGPEAVDAPRGQQLLGDDPVEQRLRVVVQLARRGAVLGVIEDRREPALQLPRGEEERPVDERHEIFERHVDAAAAEEPRDGNVVLSQSIFRRLARACAQVSSGFSARAYCSRSSAAPRSSRRTPSRCVGSSRFDTTSTARDASSTCTTAGVLGRDLHRRVLLARRRAADQQRQS